MLTEIRLGSGYDVGGNNSWDGLIKATWQTEDPSMQISFPDSKQTSKRFFLKKKRESLSRTATENRPIDSRNRLETTHVFFPPTLAVSRCSIRGHPSINSRIPAPLTSINYPRGWQRRYNPKGVIKKTALRRYSAIIRKVHDSGARRPIPRKTGKGREEEGPNRKGEGKSLPCQADAWRREQLAQCSRRQWRDVIDLRRQRSTQDDLSDRRP